MDDNRSEKEIENEILGFLWHIGIYCWKNDNVGIWDPKKKIFRRPNSRFKIKGVPDIIGDIPFYAPDSNKPFARPLYIEVKSKTGKVSNEQREFLLRAMDRGCIAFVARSVQDVITNLMKHLPNHTRIQRAATDYKVPPLH